MYLYFGHYLALAYHTDVLCTLDCIFYAMLYDALHVSISIFSDKLSVDEVYISLFLFIMNDVFIVYVRYLCNCCCAHDDDVTQPFIRHGTS